MPANAYKSTLTTQAYDTMAKNLLKGEPKRRGLTYAQLAEKQTPSVPARPNAI
jgi:hypothetical protein